MKDLIYPSVFFGTIAITITLVHLSPLAIVDAVVISISALVKACTIGTYIHKKVKSNVISNDN